MTPGAAKLRMSDISKQFPGVKALDDVSFEANRGEIVGLVGVNGAGKSTLMNVLGGIYHPDQGEIFVDGAKVAFHSPKDAEKHGISFIHQELLFFASQTVAENIFIARLFANPSFPLFVSKRTANSEAAKYLKMLGSDITPTTIMEDLSVGERQVVEIARALAVGSEVVIFDEPTSSLSLKEKDTLFKVIRRLKAEGKAIIYISHFLDEILELCDRFIVLRNGRIHGHGDIKDITKRDIIRMIIGRDINYERKTDRTLVEKPVLRVLGIRSGALLKDVGFELHEGEILGVWGLMGSGRTELIRAILGLDRIDGGCLEFREKDALRPISPAELLGHCGYITESRHTDGLFLNQPIWKNVSVTALGEYESQWGFLDTGEEMGTATKYIDLLKIAAPGNATRVQSLSGGNQQKVVFAKWLNRRARILILDEPTRGVDVGAKLEISNLIRDLSREGTSTLLITSEIEEMISLSDRVLVLREGGIVADVRGTDINNANLMSLSLGEATVQ
ncbi:MAG: sugar ABC transporter ATP-binding protein [Bauldia sp.]